MSEVGPARMRDYAQQQLESLAGWFDLDPIAVRNFVDFYNLRMDLYGNEIYSRIESRISHWLNFFEDRWFNDRLDVYLNHAGAFDVVVDLGFSVPYPYSHGADLRGSPSRFVFVDKEESARSFYNALVREADLQEMARRDQVITADIEQADTHGSILAAASETEPSSLLVVASEVLEHLRDAQPAWDLIRRLSRLPTLRTTETYVTLPIGSSIPSHALEFSSPDKAVAYLSEQLVISETKILEAPEGFAGRPYLTGCVCVIGVPR